MKYLKLSLILFLSVFGGSRASSDWFKQLAEKTFASANGDEESSTITAAAKLDRVTYTLVDTTLFLMQLSKTGMLLFGTGFEDPLGPLFDFTYNTTRVICSNGTNCVKEDIYMEFREPNLGGLDSIKLYTDFQLDRLNLTLRVDDFTLGCPGYRHTIRNNVTGDVKIGERAVHALRNTTYGISADYQLVPGTGIQVSNVDITLSIGEESWTVENQRTELENGDVIDDGLYEGDLSEAVMSIWKGQHEGESFEKSYEQWAELLLNCGLSGGKSSEACEDVKGHVSQFKSIIAKHQK